MDPPSPGGLKPQVGGPFSFSAAVAGSTVDQVVSTRPAGGLVLSQERPGPGPGRDGRAGGHAPWSCHPGCGLVPGPGCAWWWCWTGLGAAWHWWWARHLHRLGGVTCMFVFSLTFWVSIGGGVGISFWWCLGWWEGVLGVSRPSAWWDVSVTGLQGHYLGSRSGHIRPPGGRSQPLHPGQGERPDRGPDHYRGSVQGETHPEAGATPTQDHGPEEALRSHPGRCHSGGWEDRMDYEASAPSRGPATGSRMRRWPGTMEQGATLVVGRSGLDPPPRP